MADRNHVAKSEFVKQQQLAAARKQFLHAVSAGQTGVVDRYGIVLAAGDIVIWFPPPHGIEWQVKDVVPNLDPNVQPGVMTLSLTCTVDLNYFAGRRGTDLLRLRGPLRSPSPADAADETTGETTGEAAAEGDPTAEARVEEARAHAEEEINREPTIGE